MPRLADFWLYHRAVRDVRGAVLLPLNRLRDLHPDVYGRKVAKYAGREALLAEQVLPLGCEWGDVMFFSAVHPKVLLDVLRERGWPIPPLRFWVLNAAELDAAAACIKFVRPWPNGVYAPPTRADYAAFSPAVLQATSTPSPMTLARLRNLPLGAPLLLWSDVPHVLYRGQVPLALLREEFC